MTRSRLRSSPFIEEPTTRLDPKGFDHYDVPIGRRMITVVPPAGGQSMAT
jgi:hypothetical protein